MKPRNCLAMLIALLGPTAPVWADTPIRETRAVNADVHVRIENVAGRIEVRAGNDERVEITGRLGEGAKPLRVEGGGDRLTIEVESEGNGWGGRMADTELVVQVPRRARLEIEGVSTNVDVAGLAGSHAEIETVSGSIAYAADAERVVLKSVSGSIQAQGSGRFWTVGTVSGRITLPRADGEVGLESVSGSIEVTFQEASRLRAETVSGRVTAQGGIAAGGSIAMQSVSGTIALALKGTVDARFNAKTFSGPIDSDFGTPQRGGIGGGQTLNTTVGSGSADVRLESFSGRIRITRAP